MDGASISNRLHSHGSVLYRPKFSGPKTDFSHRRVKEAKAVHSAVQFGFSSRQLQAYAQTLKSITEKRRRLRDAGAVWHGDRDLQGEHELLKICDNVIRYGDLARVVEVMFDSNFPIKTLQGLREPSMAEVFQQLEDYAVASSRGESQAGCLDIGESSQCLLSSVPSKLEVPQSREPQLREDLQAEWYRTTQDGIEMHWRPQDVQTQKRQNRILSPTIRHQSIQVPGFSASMTEGIPHDPDTQTLADRRAISASRIWGIPFCYVLIFLGVVMIGGSLSVGLYYSIARDQMGDGFTTAGWMTAVGTMILAAPMAKHYPNCKCWDKGKHSSRS